VVLKKLKGVTANVHRSKRKVKEEDFLPPKLRTVVFSKFSFLSLII